jgi:hypothetical protein
MMMLDDDFVLHIGIIMRMGWIAAGRAMTLMRDLTGRVMGMGVHVLVWAAVIVVGHWRLSCCPTYCQDEYAKNRFHREISLKDPLVAEYSE